MKKLKVGKIPYLNIYPIYEKLKILDIDLIEGEPSYLNKLIHDGEIDIAPSSTFEYLKNPDKYFIIPNISISSTNKVLSVILQLNKNIENIDNEIISLSSASATSNNLLKILLKNFLKKDVIFENNNNTINKLLIGDEALTVYFNKDRNYFYYDLAELWYNFTNMPFVFALWLVNKNSYYQKKKNILTFIKKIYYAKTKFTLPLSYKNFNFKQVEVYFNYIDYSLSEKHINSIQLFSDLCSKYNLINYSPNLNFL